MKLLVIEDEHKIANSIKRGFEQESFAVDIAYDGEDGYGLAVSENYDVIILDIMVPKLNGIEVCHRLRKANIHTPILMLTAKGELEDKVEGLNAGADDYLVKPFAFAELLARVKALMRRPKGTIGTVLTHRDLTLNTLTYEVKRSGILISLSKKEYSLLEYLLRHSKTVVTKDQIINNVWNYDSDILPNTVEVYISNLRNKIDILFSTKTPLIHTVRGFGYKIE